MQVGLSTAKPAYSASGPTIHKMEGEDVKRNLPTFPSSILPILLFPVDAEDKLLY